MFTNISKKNYLKLKKKKHRKKRGQINIQSLQDLSTQRRIQFDCFLAFANDLILFIRYRNIKLPLCYC